jgi:hypothetical protein
MATYDEIRRLKTYKTIIHHKLKGVGIHDPMASVQKGYLSVKVWAKTFEVWHISEIELIMSERSDGTEEQIFPLKDKP